MIYQIQCARGYLTVSQTELPPEYHELEKRVDALKAAHQKMLNVTYVAYVAVMA